jgi:DNA-binding winged helix-turn-helix (wHTH) protein
MPAGGFGERPFGVGAWRVEPALGVITHIEDGGQARLEPKLMDLLLLFAGSGGRVLSKDDIVASVWGGRAIGDDTLAAALSRLRRALGETPADRYIETIPKRGYRLVAAGPTAATPAGERMTAEPPAKSAGLAAKGRAALATPFAANLAQARLYFEAAVREAPGWAPAHEGLAETLAALHFAGRGAELIAAAKAAAHAAVGLDPQSARAWSILGLAILLDERAFAPADQALCRAASLDPDLASVHGRRALAFAAVGRFVDAERGARAALHLDPVSLAAHGQLLQILLTARRYGQALAAANLALTLAPASSEAWYAKGWAYVLSGDVPAGVEALLKGLELWGVGEDRVGRLRHLYGQDGFAGLCAAGADLFESQTVMFTPRPTDIAFLRAAAGQFDQAFAALDAAVANDDPVLMVLPWLPYCDPLHADPRWPRLLDRARLVR